MGLDMKIIKFEAPAPTVDLNTILMRTFKSKLYHPKLNQNSAPIQFPK